MISIAFLLLTLGLLIAIEAFFSGSEVAFLSANRPKIMRKAKEKDPRALIVLRLLNRPETLFATSVVGTTIAVACSSSVVTFFISKRIGPDWEWINLFLLTPIVLLFGEFIPKLACRTFADSAVLRLGYSFRMASFILYPISRLLELYATALQSLMGQGGNKGFFLSREEIKAALPASLGTDVTQAERSMVARILESSRVTVKEVQKPLIDMVAVDESETLSGALRRFTESGHTRMPVFKERIDKVVGVIHGYDCLLANDLSSSVSATMRPAYFVPESKPLDELMSELREHHMAIVVNEYGGADGLVTLEDVMEEIVGEIEDEYDEPPRLYRQIAENSFIVNARVEVDDLRDNLGIPIPRDDDYQTLGGFLLKRMQKLPKKWDSITIDGIEYVVQSSTDRSIEEVYIIRHPIRKG